MEVLLPQGSGLLCPFSSAHTSSPFCLPWVSSRALCLFCPQCLAYKEYACQCAHPLRTAKPMPLGALPCPSVSPAHTTCSPLHTTTSLCPGPLVKPKNEASDLGWSLGDVELQGEVDSLLGFHRQKKVGSKGESVPRRLLNDWESTPSLEWV